jgi:hypothetical protein
MHFCLLPTNNNEINLSIQTVPIKQSVLSSSTSITYLSESADVYLYKIQNQFKEEILILDKDILTKLICVFNTYHFLYNKIPEYNITINKLSIFCSVFFELLDIHQFLPEIFSFISPDSNIGIYSPHYHEIEEFTRFLKIDFVNPFSYHLLDYNLIQTLPASINKNFRFKKELLFFEFDENNYDCTNEFNDSYYSHYSHYLCLTLIVLLLEQQHNGSCVIKLNNNTNKVVSQYLYILSQLYNKVYIIKTGISNGIKDNKYIICKNFHITDLTMHNMYINLVSYLFSNVDKIKNAEIILSQLIDIELPNLFLTKMEDLNIIIAHQQINHISGFLNLLKNKQLNEKLDTLKKLNIQKCIQWCEKRQIPHNKLIEKSNIFLNKKKEEPLIDENN